MERADKNSGILKSIVEEIKLEIIEKKESTADVQETCDPLTEE
jgi:hypothetical protein